MVWSAWASQVNADGSVGVKLSGRLGCEDCIIWGIGGRMVCGLGEYLITKLKSHLAEWKAAFFTPQEKCIIFFAQNLGRNQPCA